MVHYELGPRSDALFDHMYGVGEGARRGVLQPEEKTAFGERSTAFEAAAGGLADQTCSAWSQLDGEDPSCYVNVIDYYVAMTL